MDRNAIVTLPRGQQLRASEAFELYTKALSELQTAVDSSVSVLNFLSSTREAFPELLVQAQVCRIKGNVLVSMSKFYSQLDQSSFSRYFT